MYAYPCSFPTKTHVTAKNFLSLLFIVRLPIGERLFQFMKSFAIPKVLSEVYLDKDENFLRNLTH